MTADLDPDRRALDNHTDKVNWSDDMSEAWIDDSGSVTHCDGDMQDINHEGVVVVYMHASLRDQLQNEFPEVSRIFEEFEGDIIAINEYINNWGDDRGTDNAFEMIASALEDESELHIALDLNYDFRLYALQHLGWIRAVDDTFEVWKLSERALRHIGDYMFDEFGDDAYKGEMHIEEVSSKKNYVVPRSVVMNGKLSDLRQYMAYGASVAK